MTTEATKTDVRLLIVGPPGAGKGTQASVIAEAYGIPAISTGDIFRQNIADGTELGKKVDEIVSSGGYVPDSLTNEIVADRLQQPDAAQGFLLDGYPRTEEQVAELDRILAASGNSLDAVVQLTADRDEVVKRLLIRAEEQGRSDDTEDVIRHRQDVYHEQTEPVIAVYESRGLVVSVDGLGTIDAVSERVLRALAERGLAASA
ncbi:adenylate kinase [Paramicrobacterium agarici]|uniref:Adenylate kinase n=1 Tax=Paramicrobacterium agarici TaxID=630514 RepID=A0A2A9DZK7_9MICO|nr:adenylate kinase [Microbacterium agarici]PFG32128.1 adenylate kinase [Microbacterium agarici]TQO22021.1 adenylate kinase [Microbacterium agarici]